MAFDPTVRGGDVLTLIAFLIGGLSFVWSMRGELRMLSRDVIAQGRKIERVESVITEQAVQTQRLDDLDRRIEELRHGRGFIEVDGLYERRGKIQPL